MADNDTGTGLMTIVRKADLWNPRQGSSAFQSYPNKVLANQQLWSFFIEGVKEIRVYVKMAPRFNAGLQLPLVSAVSETSPPFIHTTFSSSSVLASPDPILNLGGEGEGIKSPDILISATPLPTVSLNFATNKKEQEQLSDALFVDNETSKLSPQTITTNQQKSKSSSLSDRIRSWTWTLLSWISNVLYSFFTNGKGAAPEYDALRNKVNSGPGGLSWELSRSARDSNGQILHEIPDYVLEYAPLVHLFSAEQFWPCDIGEHLTHITPYLNYTPLRATWEHPLLDNLDDLNNWQHGRHVFLTSNENVENRPEWLHGKKNIPEPVPYSRQKGRFYRRSIDFLSQNTQMLGYFGRKGKTAGKSKAPAVLIVIDKGDGIVDAFWFYFYSFNLGNEVFNLRFGNHVGDWEHSLVRFHRGEPKAIFLSEHSGGEAYTYNAMEKLGKRPVIYSATGTHAIYANPGIHSYILPWGLLRDQTDAGPLWDPSLNMHAYAYSPHNDTLYPSNRTPNAPTEWFSFRGHWGDKIYPLGDRRQYRFAGQYHYVSGPLGPRFKNLARRKVCQGPEEDICIIRNEVGAKGGREHAKVGVKWDAGLRDDDGEDQV
ncbi:Vacuolar protein sorting-associated protein 62 [Coccidioides immitis]|nr:Vacuolar protein sorting-associated protein 62 [Coccidioides immitis]